MTGGTTSALANHGRQGSELLLLQEGEHVGGVLGPWVDPRQQDADAEIRVEVACEIDDVHHVGKSRGIQLAGADGDDGPLRQKEGGSQPGRVGTASIYDNMIKSLRELLALGVDRLAGEPRQRCPEEPASVLSGR